MIITPKNWSDFQHYKNRSPAWIKLHRGLLDNFDFHCLPLASRALAPMLWLLASEYEEGQISATVEEMAFRFRMAPTELSDALTPLIQKGFFIASEPIADCKQVASTTLAERLPREREEEEKEKEKKDAAHAAPVIPSDEADYFRRMKEICGKAAGGLARQLLTAKGGSVPLARAAAEQSSTKQDPREYIGAIIRNRDGADDLRARGDAW